MSHACCLTPIIIHPHISSLRTIWYFLCRCPLCLFNAWVNALSVFHILAAINNYNQVRNSTARHCQHLSAYTTKGIFSLAYRLIRICSNSSEYSTGLENEFSPLDDWNLHLQYRMKKVPTAPSKLSSRLEDLQRDLKCRKYKDSSLLLAFEKALLIPREKALEKVEKKKKGGGINSPVPNNIRLTMGPSLENTGLTWFRNILN